MTLVSASLALALLSASPDVGLALTKRSGVSKAVVSTRAGLVREKLQLTGEVQDLTSCQTRLPCLLKNARENKWTTLVTIETANVLGDAIIDVKVLSVEEDGREVARGNAQVAEKDLAGALEARLSDVKRALGPIAPTPPVEPILVTTPPPPPPPVEPAPSVATVSSRPPTETRPAARWVPLGISLAVTAAGGIALGASEGMANQLRTATPLDQVQIDALVSSGKTWRTVGLVGVIAGGTLTAASLILALVWPESRVSPSAFWLPGGGGLAVGGAFP